MIKTSFQSHHLVRLRLLFCAALLLFGVFPNRAQESNVLSAWEYMQVYQSERANGNLRVAVENLLNAKKAIDEACRHEKTSLKSKTWKRKLDVYLLLLTDTSKELMPYKAEALQGILEAAQKARTVEPGKIFEEKDLNLKQQLVANIFFKAGFEAFERKLYDAAFQSFEQCYNLKKALNVEDTVSLTNMFLSAYNAKKADKALEIGLRLKSMGAADPAMYRTLSNLYLERGDTAQGLQVVREARSKFPNKPEFITEELNFYLITKNNAMASKTLEEAIRAFANDPQMLKLLYFNSGVIYAQAGDREKAMAAYRKSIEYDPNYYAAYNNLAAFFVDDGNELIKQANNLPLNETKKYEELKQKAREKYLEAAVLLEKAYQLKPDDKLKNTLRDIFIKIGDEAKVQQYSR
ncbi:MAG: tetratricopeptide repeat protein [Flavobacteriales bacterium]|nr:tetratricopeptide repeat protein [Flavobacteriales bacterium]MCX7767998.1 tetratricopeptide repeat protein [Flavobacteriales bacterium]MDW8409203.1 tetratricopeptide repeat protein [Flavobacteriales bacterium]